MNSKVFITLTLLAGFTGACHFGNNANTKLLEQAVAESSAQVLRITGIGDDPSEISYAYLTGSSDNRRLYALSCPHEDFGEDTKGRKAMIKSLGFDIDNETPALLDANNSDKKKLLTKWKFGEQPVLKCRYDNGTVNLRAVNYPAPVNETKYFLSFPERRTVEGKVIMYNLGCEGLIAGLGLSKDKAAVMSYDSLKADYDSSDLYDISCMSGKSPSNTTSFVNGCMLAKSSGDPLAWKTYKKLMAVAGVSESSLTACADTETKIKTLAQLDLSNASLTDLKPLSYFTQLVELDLSHNAIADFSVLSALVQLKVLKLDDNGIANVAALAKVLKDLKFLSTLSLRSNSLQSADGLGEVLSLQSLDLGANGNLSNMSALKTLVRLETLKLDATKVIDLSALESLVSLANLDMSNDTGLTFKSFDVLKYTKVQYPVLVGTPLTWSSVSQTFFTNCLMLDKIPADQAAPIKEELTSLGAVFDSNGKNKIPCQTLEKEKLSTWALDPNVDLGGEGGTANDGLCNGREKCIFIDRDGRYWKGWDGVPRTYNEAESYCQNLVYGNFDDWRMPTQEELLRASQAHIGKLNNPQFQVIGSWSTTSSAGREDRSQFVLFRSGGQIVNAGKSSKLPYLVCVR